MRYDGWTTMDDDDDDALVERLRVRTMSQLMTMTMIDDWMTVCATMMTMDGDDDQTVRMSQCAVSDPEQSAAWRRRGMRRPAQLGAGQLGGLCRCDLDDPVTG